MQQQSIPVFLSLLLMSVFTFFYRFLLLLLLLEILIHRAYGNYHLDNTITGKIRKRKIYKKKLTIIIRGHLGGEGKKLRAKNHRLGCLLISLISDEKQIHLEKAMSKIRVIPTGYFLMSHLVGSEIIKKNNSPLVITFA